MYQTLPKSGPQTYVPDDDYDLVQPLPMIRKKGVQCGVCGAKFDYGQAVGYVCANLSCPVQPKAM